MKFTITIHETEDFYGFPDLALADALDAIKDEIDKNGVPNELMPLTVTVCGDCEFEIDYGIQH